MFPGLGIPRDVPYLITPAITVSSANPSSDAAPKQDFIRSIVAEDLRAGRHESVVTRFPPEPNGYLHIGHAKSIALNFGIAAETGGRCHLRFDDTNPETEDIRYVESIIDTVRWLGYDWGKHLYFAADYFDRMYEYGEFLIERGLAYVDGSSEEEIREGRGTVTQPGTASRFRDAPPESSLDLFRRMRAGEFPDGSYVLRARIDMAASNMLLRDPILYRVRHAHHYRTEDRWCVYPLYDFAHPIEDAIEGVTHSICTLEFENNRPLYDWVVEHWQDFVRSQGATPSRPRQYEFARGNLDYTVMSKRKLLELVDGGYVAGWDDPRLPTLAGLRRRGVTPQAIRSFWERLGVAKVNSRVDIGKLEYAVRDDLNHQAPRVLCVIHPLRVVITNYPDGSTEELDASHWPHDVPRTGSRPLPFSREIFIERDDFMEDPPKGYHRLAPGREVRLRYAYFITCQEVVRDEHGEVVELRCTYDPTTRGGSAPDGRTVKGTIHWVSAPHSLPCEVRLYDRLFTIPDPDEGEGDFKDHLNPDSLVTVTGARIEPGVRGDPPGSVYQFERQGYFVADRVESTPDALVYNRTVTLRDTWARRAQSLPVTSAAGRPDPGEERADTRQRSASRGGESRSGAPSAPPHRTAELEGKRGHYQAALGLSPEEAEILSREMSQALLFEAALDRGASAKSVANWVIHELPREVGGRTLENLPFSGGDLGDLVRLVEDGTLSSSAAREVLAEMVGRGEPPAVVVERRGLRQLSDPAAIAPLISEVLAENPAKVQAYRDGKSGLLGFFMGQVMARSRGRANPELASRLLREALERS
jgi:glutaminyl-tRNA synthetase